MANKLLCDSSKSLASSWVYNDALAHAPVTCCLDLWNDLALISSFPTSASFKTHLTWLQGQILHHYSLPVSGVIITALIKQAGSSTIVCLIHEIIAQPSLSNPYPTPCYDRRTTVLWSETPINLAHVLIKNLFLAKYMIDQGLCIKKWKYD